MEMFMAAWRQHLFTAIETEFQKELILACKILPSKAPGPNCVNVQSQDLCVQIEYLNESGCLYKPLCRFTFIVSKCGCQCILCDSETWVLRSTYQHFSLFFYQREITKQLSTIARRWGRGGRNQSCFHNCLSLNKSRNLVMCYAHQECSQIYL